MRYRASALLIAAIMLASAKFCPARAASATCASLKDLKLPHTTITLAQEVGAGGFRPSRPQFKDVPAFCRVAGTIKPTSDSNIRFEVWMPVSGWNGKFDGAGNGGFAGSIQYEQLASAVRMGFATASTDTGHTGSATDGRWALGHPEKVIDFGYRGIHEMTVKAKAIVQRFYGVAPRWSYFASCSNGGRQALMEAQRFPEDYDGIIAGAPANFWTHLLTAAVWVDQATLAHAVSYIPPSKLPAISAAVLAACDAEDGVTDGILNDPRRCHFNPATLLCRSADSNSCLTAPEVTALEKIYRGPRNSRGEQIFPGYEPGGELGNNGWAPWITGSAPEKSLLFAFGTQFFSNMVFSNPDWDYRKLNFDSDVQLTDRKLARILNATDPNLSTFKAHGGKLIMFHGWNDSAIAPVNTVNYYKSVVARMGLHQTRDFLRLYMAPGVQHCALGPGPSAFGASVEGAKLDPQHSIFSALERWVEGGIAPDDIIATKYRNPANSASGALMTRPLCPYPEIARYKGTGDPNDARNFVCAP